MFSLLGVRPLQPDRVHVVGELLPGPGFSPGAGGAGGHHRPLTSVFKIIEIVNRENNTIFLSTDITLYDNTMHSNLCTEELIFLRSLATKIAKINISAVRYTNVNGLEKVQYWSEKFVTPLI